MAGGDLAEAPEIRRQPPRQTIAVADHAIGCHRGYDRQ
jgi:hypothetical protein